MKEEFQITENPQVFLDGRPCKYQDVPGDADIILEVAAENPQAVAKIQFRSRK